MVCSLCWPRVGRKLRTVDVAAAKRLGYLLLFLVLLFAARIFTSIFVIIGRESAASVAVRGFFVGGIARQVKRNL